MGAGLALVATKATSASVVIMFGAVIYAVGAGFASRTRDLAEGSRTTRFAEEAKRILHDIAEGVRQIAKRPAAALGVTSFLTLRTLISFASLVFALQAREILGGKSSNTAVIIAGLSAAAGAALGFVAAQVLKDRVPPPRLIVGAMIVAGAGMLALGGVKSTVGLSVVAFVAALAYFVGKISADTIMQQSLPDQYRGRGFSFFDVAYNLAWIIPAVVLFVAWTGDNARLLMIGAGVVFLLGALATAAWYRRLGRDAFVLPGEALPSSTGEADPVPAGERRSNGEVEVPATAAAAESDERAGEPS
jgi:hypothetical protein